MATCNILGELCMLVGIGEEEFKGKKEFKLTQLGHIFKGNYIFFILLIAFMITYYIKKNIALNMFHVTCF